MWPCFRIAWEPYQNELEKEEATYDIIVITEELTREVAMRPENMR